jgi:3-hydroxyisobutyrate dehydrogenase-like beta-hydroxyacid dehydrogenase
LLISVCPPESALEVARAVAAAGFRGLYGDFNAIAPERAREIEKMFAGRYVDGGIIGPPARVAGSTRLYLSGERSPEVAALFAGTLLEPRLLASPKAGVGNTAASALKMSYAAWTKGSAALLLNARALAEALGVGDALEAEWAISQSGTLERAEATVSGVAPKAWRFSGEMKEIAATFNAAGLPSGFHLGAAEFYELLAQFKNQSGLSLADLLQSLDRDSD